MSNRRGRSLLWNSYLLRMIVLISRDFLTAIAERDLPCFTTIPLRIYGKLLDNRRWLHSIRDARISSLSQHYSQWKRWRDINTYRQYHLTIGREVPLHRIHVQLSKRVSIGPAALSQQEDVFAPKAQQNARKFCHEFVLVIRKAKHTADSREAFMDGCAKIKLPVPILKYEWMSIPSWPGFQSNAVQV